MSVDSKRRKIFSLPARFKEITAPATPPTDTVDVYAKAGGQLFSKDDLGRESWLSALIVCTSTTRPASPIDGMHIYETDTKRTYIHDGTTWKYQSGGNDPVGCRARHSNAAYNTAGNATPDILRLDVEDWDYGNNFNTTTYKYTASEVFNAAVTARLSIIGVAGDRVAIAAYVNNVEINRGLDFYCQANQRFTVSLAATLHLNVNDVLDFRIAQYTGAAHTIDVGGNGELYYATIDRA